MSRLLKCHSTWVGLRHERHERFVGLWVVSDFPRDAVEAGTAALAQIIAQLQLATDAFSRLVWQILQLGGDWSQSLHFAFRCLASWDRTWLVATLHWLAPVNVWKLHEILSVKLGKKMGSGWHLHPLQTLMVSRQSSSLMLYELHCFRVKGRLDPSPSTSALQTAQTWVPTFSLLSLLPVAVEPDVPGSVLTLTSPKSEQERK